MPFIPPEGWLPGPPPESGQWNIYYWVICTDREGRTHRPRVALIYARHAPGFKENNALHIEWLMTGRSKGEPQPPDHPLEAWMNVPGLSDQKLSHWWNVDWHMLIPEPEAPSRPPSVMCTGKED